MSGSDADRNQGSEAGFTIVELMIATMVFSVILTIITAGVISFTNRFYKGINSSNTQASAQTIIDTVSQAIQFSGTPVDPTTPSSNYFCAGGYNFTIDEGTMYDGVALNGGLYMAPKDAICHAKNTGGRQLLSKDMRVSNLTVTKITPAGSTRPLYKITVSIAYGADDLLCAPTTYPGSCSSTSPLATYWGLPDLRCKPVTGSQFCATSELTTIVEQRVGT